MIKWQPFWCPKLFLWEFSFWWLFHCFSKPLWSAITCVKTPRHRNFCVETRCSLQSFYAMLQHRSLFLLILVTQENWENTIVSSLCQQQQTPSWLNYVNYQTIKNNVIDKRKGACWLEKMSTRLCCILHHTFIENQPIKTEPVCVRCEVITRKYTAFRSFSFEMF